MSVTAGAKFPGPGAGLLYDLGPHLIDQTLLLFGIPDSVQATLAKQRRGARTDDFFQLVLRYGEMVATLGAGSLVSGGSARFSVHGDRASVVKQKPDIQEDQLRAGICQGGPLSPVSIPSLSFSFFDLPKIQLTLNSIPRISRLRSET